MIVVECRMYYNPVHAPAADARHCNRFFIFIFKILGFVLSLAKDLWLVMFLILSKFEPHVLNFLGTVQKGRSQSDGRGVCPVRTFCRQGGRGVFRYGRPHFCGQGERGQFFEILCGRPSWTVPYHTVLIQNSNV